MRGTDKVHIGTFEEDHIEAVQFGSRRAAECRVDVMAAGPAQLHRHAVHQTGYLNHLLRADGHGLGFRESATGTLVQVHLFPLLRLHDGEGGGLQNDAGRGRGTDFSYFFVGLEKDRRKGVLVSREAESGAPKRAGEHTAAFWRRRPQTVEKPLLIDGTAPSRDRKDIGTRAQSIVRGERNGIG